MRKVLLCLTIITAFILNTPGESSESVSDFVTYIQLIEKYCEKYNYNADWTISVFSVESKFNPNAKSNKDARGLGQILLPTARIYDKDVTAKDLYVPEKNIDLCIQHLKMLDKKHKGNKKRAILEYFWGNTNQKNSYYYWRVYRQYYTLIKNKRRLENGKHG